MTTLRDWDVTAVAFRLAARWGDEDAVQIAERLIRKWAESEAPHAACAVVRWVRIKAVLLTVTTPAPGLH